MVKSSSLNAPSTYRLWKPVTGTIDAKQPKSLAVAARALAALPFEIAHTVLLDIPVYRILQMSVSLQEHDDPWKYHQCLFELPHQHSIFVNRHHTHCMLELYKLYYELCKTFGRRPNPRTSPLALNMNVARSYSVRWLEDERQKMQDWLASEIHLMLRSVERLDNELWSPYLRDLFVSGWHTDPRVIEELQDCWKDVKRRYSSFEQGRRQQIDRFANFFEKYPKLVKKASDPASSARPNVKHIIGNLQHCKTRFTKNMNVHFDMAGRYRKSCYLFRYDTFPIVPLDSLLRYFIKTIKQYPLPKSFVDKQITQLADHLPQINEEERCVWPEKMLLDIKTSIASLTYVYTAPEQPEPSAKTGLRAKQRGRLPQIPRTKNVCWNKSSQTDNDPPNTFQIPIRGPTLSPSPFSDFPSPASKKRRTAALIMNDQPLTQPEKLNFPLGIRRKLIQLAGDDRTSPAQRRADAKFLMKSHFQARSATARLSSRDDVMDAYFAKVKRDVKRQRDMIASIEWIAQPVRGVMESEIVRDMPILRGEWDDGDGEQQVWRPVGKAARREERRRLGRIAAAAWAEDDHGGGGAKPVFVAPPYPHLLQREDYRGKFDGGNLRFYLGGQDTGYGGDDGGSSSGGLEGTGYYGVLKDRRGHSIGDGEGWGPKGKEVEVYPEKEFEWLEAFCRVVEWMRENGMGMGEEKGDGLQG